MLNIEIEESKHEILENKSAQLLKIGKKEGNNANSTKCIARLIAIAAPSSNLSKPHNTS